MLRPLLALAWLLTPALGGCMFTTASLQGLGGTRYPAQRADIDAGGPTLVLQELEGARRRAIHSISPPPGRPAPRYRVIGGPVRSTCACFRSAFGLVEHHEGLPWEVQVLDADGGWSPAGAARPFEERSLAGAALSYCLLPLTLGLDLALLPFEAVFVLARM